MNILITGSEGQLGRVLSSNKPSNINLISKSKDYLDITCKQSCEEVFKKYSPDWVINCAAYTSVDLAEENKNSCQEVNGKGPKIIAEVAKKFKTKVIHISTDFVFKGDQNIPYKPEDKISPINFYGKSKADGEKSIRKILANNSLTIRTSWLMGSRGKNFLTTMIDLHKKNKVIKVVYDQIGSPTSLSSLSFVCWKAIQTYEKGISVDTNVLHWSDAGVASWYDVATSIGEIAKDFGILNKPAKVIPILSKEYPTLAKRPNYSVLDSSLTCSKLDIEQIHWRKNLVDNIKTIAGNI